MNISEILKLPHLSASSIGTYMECGLCYKFGKIDKLKPEFTSDNLLFGSAIHQTLGAYYLEKKIGKIMSIKEIHAAFEEFWEIEAKDREGIQFSNGKNYQTLMIEGKDLLSAWHSKLLPDQFTVIGVEEGFSFQIPGMDIPIVGFIDLMEEDQDTLIITDFKTAGKAYSADDIDKNMQITLYELAMKSNGYADREIILRLDCLIKTKTPKFEQYYTIRTEDDEKRLIRKIQKVREGILKEVYIPNDSSWKCKGCSYKTACKQWFLEGGN